MFGSPWIWSFFAAAVLLILLTTYRFDRLSYLNYMQQVRSDTNLEIMRLREDIEEVIHSQSLVLRELATFIGDDPDITQAEFSLRVQTMRGVDASMINIAAAPDLVVSLVYPVKGNESVLGFDYRDSVEQFPVVQDIMQAGVASMTGPVNLVQGGLGIILRAPVYLPGGDTPGAALRPWGIVSIVLDYQQFIDKVGVLDAASSYDLLINIAGPSGEHERDFFGDIAVEDSDPVTQEFDVPFGSWHLHATTKGGWPQSSPTQWHERAVMAVAAMGLLLLLGYIVWLSESRKLAETRLINGIEALNNGFVMFDPDDRLVVSNAKYREIYDFPKDLMAPGTPFEDIAKVGVTRELYTGEPGMENEWRANLLEEHRSAASIDLEQHLVDGSVIKVSDRRMKDGSLVGLRVDVSELSRAKAAAEAASKAKTDFMGVLSHELRTPLTVILGVARLASNARLLNSSKALLAAQETGDRSPAEIKTMLDDMFAQLSGLMDRMVQSGDHLLHLINEMLDFAKIESGSLSVTCAPCDIVDIVDPITQQLSTLSREKGLEFEVTQDPGTAWADKVRARQILFNLVGNAIKFTDSGYVRLSVKVGTDAVVFEVHDSGAGIPEDEFDSIFDAFYQIDSTATRRANGTGMGLAISRNLADLQGGSLTVTSTLGEGSCFVLTLPSAEMTQDAESDSAEGRHVA
tara:strand:- start:180 stop:2243 length:2064 start_codon:yes stop_codon:yes gene_type:complete